MSANPILSDSPGKPPPSTFNYRWDTSPALNAQFKFHVDHIFPKSGFTRRKLKALGLADEEIDYFVSAFNLLPNLQLLDGVVNQSKLDTPFDEWSKSMREAGDQTPWTNYCAQHLIPKLHDYELRNFRKFFEGRQERLLEKLKQELPCQ